MTRPKPNPQRPWEPPTEPGVHRRGMRACLVAPILLALVASQTLAQDPFLRRTATVEVVENAGPAVVSIATEKMVEEADAFGNRRRNPQFNRYFSDLFEPHRQEGRISLGSGVIISKSGLVLTNEHVVTGASRIEISLADGRSFSARVIGADPTNDVAILQAEADEDLPWIPPGDSADIMVGEPVIAIGNPFGFSNTVTTGVVSAVDRSVRGGSQTFHGFIQTDASINDGNSGGPLLNAQGTMIGINTLVHQNSEGIAFAIPIDVAKRVMQELIEHGEVPPVTLGLEFQRLDPALSEVIGLPPAVGGALVNRVHPGGSADLAGLRRGDVLTEFEGIRIENARRLFEMLQSMTPGQNVQVQIWRDDHFETVDVVARKIPDNVAGQLASRLLGVDLRWQEPGYYGVTRVRNGSPAHNNAIKKGDILLAVNGLPLNDEKSLKRAMLGLRGRDRALIMVQRGPGRYSLSIPMH